MSADSDIPASQCPKVWLIIPVHNRAAITGRCLRHLQDLAVPLWMQVLVVDDGSSDETASMLASEFPWAAVMQGDGSLWWAGAIRLGMGQAIQQGAECICWLNDDTLPDAGSLEKLVHHALRKQAVCGGICPTDATTGFSYGGGSMVSGWPIPLRPMPGPGSAPMPVEWLHGNMVAIPAAVWQRIGLPDSRWARHHFADVLYTHAAVQSGFPVLLLPDATGKADWNDEGSYFSWLDPRLSFRSLFGGFANPKMWWYAPGVACFQVRCFGLIGLLRFLMLFPKAAVVALLKWLPSKGRSG
jgi:GT2 family glycosyltransferase